MTLTDKLAIFVDDMRRMAVPCLPPCVNASGAEFSVEEVGVRYALGALKGVGEKAMEQLCAERAANGPFTDLDNFADRVDPRLLNRRQLESLAAAGGFDGLAGTDGRAGVFAAAETILAHAASAHDSRTSGQGGLFGEAGAGAAPIRLPKSAHWSLAERMAAEKEAFGFYFSAHPTDRYRHLAAANGARSFIELAAMPVAAEPQRSPEGRRIPAPTMKMAALIEDARWRTSARGRRYMMATCSDASGQFIATCFDDAASADIEVAARAGGCALLSVELDRRPGEDTPRVTIRGVQSFDAMANTTRLRMEVRTDDPLTMPALAALLGGARGGRGELRVKAILPDGGAADLLLGRDFLLDAELAAQVERLPGVTVILSPIGPRLELVA